MADEVQEQAIADGMQNMQEEALDPPVQAVIIQPQAQQAEAAVPVAPDPGDLLQAVARIVNDNIEMLE